MSDTLLRSLSAAEVSPRRQGIDESTLQAARAIVDDVRTRGTPAVREHAERFGDLQSRDPMLVSRDDLQAALNSISSKHRELLEQTAARIRLFAERQRECLHELNVTIPGGSAGHTIEPVARAGCYAPGGRFPLPSSLLMTAVTARAAGVETIFVASPRPTPITLAAAAIAQIDGLLAIGGAQAIAALAFGMDGVPAADIIVGPGNRWVTAAKHFVSACVRIDMLAGPSELLIVADHSASAALIAADLLAQAEHDDDAAVVLVATSAELVKEVDYELRRQIQSLPNGMTARRALANGFATVVNSLDEAIEVSNRFAPEHLQLMVRNVDRLLPLVRHCGCLFIGTNSAEVFGDYGAGPNHVLPTGGTARGVAGLSVMNFLRIRTWLQITDPSANEMFARDAAILAHLEGLEGHARAAEARLPQPSQ